MPVGITTMTQLLHLLPINSKAGEVFQSSIHLPLLCQRSPHPRNVWRNMEDLLGLVEQELSLKKEVKREVKEKDADQKKKMVVEGHCIFTGNYYSLLFPSVNILFVSTSGPISHKLLRFFTSNLRVL